MSFTQTLIEANAVGQDNVIKFGELVATECINTCMTVLQKEYFAAGSKEAIIQEQIVMDCVSAIKERFGV